jgi:hypothetical protein
MWRTFRPAAGRSTNGSRESTRLEREVAGFEARPAAHAAGSSKKCCSAHPRPQQPSLHKPPNERKEVRDVVPEQARHASRAQWLPLRGQVANSAGGHAWAVDVWTRLRRFLILGSDGGSYYASEWTLTRENAAAVEATVREDGLRAVAEIVTVSREGRAPKNDPALFALAMAAGLGDEAARARLRSRRCREWLARARTCSSS